MLDHLRYFQAVARCGSLSAAARVLQVSQPGLTAVIKQLEESFGTRLLVRLRTGVSLTSTGEELLRFANESLIRLDQLIDDCHDFLLRPIEGTAGASP